MDQWFRLLDYLTTHESLSPIRRVFATSFVNYKKGCTRFAVASDKVYQLLTHVRWFSPGTPASSTTKTGRHDVAEILLKVALNTINLIKSPNTCISFIILYIQLLNTCTLLSYCCIYINKLVKLGSNSIHLQDKLYQVGALFKWTSTQSRCTQYIMW